MLEGGVAPGIGYAGRIAGDSTTGFYVGAAVHYYLGIAFARTNGTGGFVTGNPIFGAPVKPTVSAVTDYSKAGNAFAHGWGGAVGAAWVPGPDDLGGAATATGRTL